MTPEVTCNKCRPVTLKKDAPKVSASMATALLVYSGIALKMLVDQRLDAALHTMFMVEYEPGGNAHPHDHPLEDPDPDDQRVKQNSSKMSDERQDYHGA